MKKRKVWQQFVTDGRYVWPRDNQSIMYKQFCCQQVLKSQVQVRVQVQVPSTTALLAYMPEVDGQL